jgi:small neutral amino acid transporter SnatA (MarC family)
MSATTSVRGEIRRLIAAWLWLLALGAVEFAASFLPLPRAWRPLILIPGALMAVVVAISFMEVKKGPPIVRAFAVAALFWLVVLLALGSADPLSRKNYLVPKTSLEPPNTILR